MDSRFQLERKNNEQYESHYKVAWLVNYLQPIKGSSPFVAALYIATAISYMLSHASFASCIHTLASYLADYLENW